MRCKRLDDLLPGYLDGDLPRRLNQQVSDHLDCCERCRQELVAQQQAMRSLDSARRAVSIDLWADFTRRLEAQAPPRPAPWQALRQPRVAVALAAAAVALVIVTVPKRTPIPTILSNSAPAKVAAMPPADLLFSHSIDFETKFGTAADPRWLPGSSSMAPARHRPPALRYGSHLSRRRRERHTFLASNAGYGRRRFRMAVRRSTTERSASLTVLAEDRHVRTRPGGAVTLADVPPQETASGLTTGKVSTAESRHGATGDPVRVAESLVSAEKDAATDQMSGELLRLAKEVARLGGEASPGGTESQPSGDASSTDSSRAPSPNSMGT